MIRRLILGGFLAAASLSIGCNPSPQQQVAGGVDEAVSATRVQDAAQFETSISRDGVEQVTGGGTVEFDRLITSLSQNVITGNGNVEFAFINDHRRGSIYFQGATIPGDRPWWKIPEESLRKPQPPIADFALALVCDPLTLLALLEDAEFQRPSEPAKPGPITVRIPLEPTRDQETAISLGLRRVLAEITPELMVQVLLDADGRISEMRFGLPAEGRIRSQVEPEVNSQGSIDVIVRFLSFEARAQTLIPRPDEVSEWSSTPASIESGRETLKPSDGQKPSPPGGKDIEQGEETLGE